jgi:predicted phosphodiesterase
MVKRYLYLPVLLLLTSLSASALQFSISAPRQVNPQFTEPAKAFVVEVKAATNGPVPTWVAKLSNDLRNWDVNVESCKAGRIANGTEDGWKLSVRVSGDVPPELFDLTLGLQGGPTQTVCRAVSVVQDLESDFYLLHITDEHVREELASQSKEPKNGFRTAELVRWGTPVVNLVNPRFVVNSGDCTYQYHSSGARANPANLLERYANAKAGYRVPCITVTGNHDVAKEGEATHDGSTAQWEKELGQRTFSVRLGSFYVLGHDFSDKDLRDWAAAEYSSTGMDSSIKGRLIVQHFAAYNTNSSGDWFAFRPTASMPVPDLMLIGHVHMTRVEQVEPFPVLMSIAAHRSARAGFVEFKKGPDGKWSSPSVAKWGGPSALALVGDHGAPKVSADFSALNDGSQTANEVKLRNELSASFHDGRIRFLMKRGDYSVSGGKVLAQYSYVGDSGAEQTAVLVRVNLPANGKSTVSIRPR